MFSGFFYSFTLLLPCDALLLLITDFGFESGRPFSNTIHYLIMWLCFSCYYFG